MKLIEALQNVIKEYPSTPRSEDFSRVFDAWGNHNYDEFQNIFKSYSLQSWLCTDTHVGLDVLFMDDELIGYTWQPARKSDTELKFISLEIANKVRERFLSLIYNENDLNSYILNESDKNEDIGDTYKIQYSSQIIHNKAIYRGEEVKIVAKYDYGRKYDEHVPDQFHSVKINYQGKDIMVTTNDLQFSFKVKI